MKKLNKKGFTIVELVIVIAVIAILAGVLIPTFAGIVSKANKSAREQEAAAGLKAMLVQENGEFDTNYTYTFVIVDGNDVYAYTYASGKLGDETKVTTAKTLVQTEEDYMYTASGEFSDTDKIVYTEDTAANPKDGIIKVEDLGNVIVLKEKNS